MRFNQVYLNVTTCVPQPTTVAPTPPAPPRQTKKPAVKSRWMQDFFRGPHRTLAQAIRIANATS